MYFLHRPIRFEVWDRDYGWDDDLLGKAEVAPTTYLNSMKFPMNHGSLFIQLSVVCAPSLQGSLCDQYLATPSYKGIMGYMKEDRQDHWGSGKSGPEADGAHGSSFL